MTERQQPQQDLDMGKPEDYDQVEDSPNQGKDEEISEEEIKDIQDGQKEGIKDIENDIPPIENPLDKDRPSSMDEAVDIIKKLKSRIDKLEDLMDQKDENQLDIRVQLHESKVMYHRAKMDFLRAELQRKYGRY